MFRAFLKDSAIYSIPHFITSGLSIFLVPIFTRVLSPADYGALDLFTAFLAIVKLTIALEVTQSVARFFPQEKDPDQQIRYASSAFWFTVIAYTVFVALCAWNSKMFSRYLMGKDGLESTYLLGLVYLWFNGVFYVIQNQLRWELRAKTFAVISLLMTFVTAGTSVLFVYFFSWGINGLFLGMTTGSVAGFLSGWWCVRNSIRFVYDNAKLVEMLKFSIPFVPSSIAVWVSAYVDRVMINQYLTLDDVGLYGMGSRVAAIAGIALAGVSASATPLVYKHFQDPSTPAQLARVFRSFVAAALILFLGLTLFANDILVLFTTPKYYSGSVVVCYLIPANILAQMYVFTPGILIEKKTHLVLWINIGGAILGVVFNLLLIPKLGIIGAGLANLLSRAVVFAAFAIFSQRYYPVPHNWIGMGIVAGMTFAMALLLPLIPVEDVYRWLINLSALVFLAIMIVAFELIKRSELDWLGRAIQRPAFSGIQNDLKK